MSGALSSGIPLLAQAAPTHENFPKDVSTTYF